MSHTEAIVVGTHVSEHLNGSETSDLVVGLSGNDTVNTQGGDDVVHGDFVNTNLLNDTDTATSFAQYGETGS